MSRGQDERRRAALAALAPGTALRDGLERILRGSTGALIVLGFDQAVDDICSGGFELNVAFSATRLRELAKMDGAIVLDGAARHDRPGRRPAGPRPGHADRRVGHPAPDRGAGGQADRATR